MIIIIIGTKPSSLNWKRDYKKKDNGMFNLRYSAPHNVESPGFEYSTTAR